MTEKGSAYVPDRRIYAQIYRVHLPIYKTRTINKDTMADLARDENLCLFVMFSIKGWTI